MTKEELGKEAVNEAEELKEYQTAPKNEYEKGFNNGEIRGFKDGYLAGAEPREKRIAELEKENAELKKKCYKKAVKDYCKLEKENTEIKEQLTKKADTNHSLVEQMADLEARNAELKEKIKELKCCGNCQTVRNAEGVCYFLKDGTCNPRTRIKWVQKNDSKILEKQYPMI